MIREGLLLTVALWHAVLVAAMLSTLAVLGRPVADAAIGGIAIGASFLLLWGLTRGIVLGGRRAWIALLGTMKVLGYLALVGAGFAGWLRVDPIGFAAGITCFLVAVLATLATEGLRGAEPA